MHRQRNSVYKKVPAEVLEKLPCCFIRSSSRKTTLLRCNKCALFRGKIEHILKKDSDVHAKNSYALKVLIPCTCRSSASTLTAAGKAFLINLLLAKPNLIVRSSIVMPEFCSTFPASKVEWNTVKHFLKNAKRRNKIIAKAISDKPRKTKYSESKPAKQKDELMSKSKQNNQKEQKKDFTVPKRYGSQDELPDDSVIQKEEMIPKSKQKRKRSVHKNNAKTRKSRRLRGELPDDSVILKEVEWNTVKHFLKNAKQTNKIIAKDISDKPRKTKYSESKPAKQKDELMSKSKRNNKKEQKKDFTVPKRYGSQDEIQKEEMISKSKQKRKRSVHKNNAKTRKSRRLRRELPDDSVIPKEEMVPQSKQKRKKNATIRRSSRIREIKSHKHK